MHVTPRACRSVPLTMFTHELPLGRRSKKLATPCVTSYLKTLYRKVASFMNLPTLQEPRHGGRWETIRYALDSNARTLRLCLICLVLSAPIVTVIVEWIRHVL